MSADKISQSYKNISWVIFAYFLYTLAMSFAKLIDQKLSISTMVFMKSLFSMVFFAPLLLDQGVGYFKTSRLKLHLLRVILSGAAMFFTYYTYTTIPISLATSIGFSGPILLASLSVMILKEKMSTSQWVAIIIGYGCVFIIIQPVSFVLSHGIITSILANTFAGLAIITTKILTKTEHKKTLMLYTNTAILIIMGILSAFTWTTPSLKSLLLLSGMGISALAYQYCFIKATSLEKLSVLAPFEYTRLLFAIPIGMLLFHETISLWMIIGSMILVGCNYYIAATNNQKLG
jgi:drug/metabolite transporter (DMT)-like permease